MPSRRTILAMLVVLSLAGCVGGLTAPDSPSSPTSPTDTEPTPTPTECDEHRQDVTDPVRENVTPSQYPDRPATWNESSVRAYAVAFEEAWSRNQRLRSNTKQVTVAVSDVVVTPVDSGYRVRLTSRTNTWHGGPAEGNETATIVHGDGAWIPVAYHLTDGRLVRTEGDYGTTPTVGPRAGRTVQCFD